MNETVEVGTHLPLTEVTYFILLSSLFRAQAWLRDHERR